MPILNDNNTQGSLNGAQEGHSKKSPREILQKFLNYIPLFLLSLILCIGATYFYLRYKNPVYKTSINIIVKDDAESGGDMSKQILSELTGSGLTNVANEIRIIQTSTLMEKVVRKNSLNVEYRSRGNIREVELYDRSNPPEIVFKNIRDSSASHEVRLSIDNDKIYYLKNKTKVEIPNNSTISEKNFDAVIRLNPNLKNYRSNYSYKAKWYPPAEMAESLAGQIAAKSLDDDATIINLTLLSETPAKARFVLDELASAYSQSDLEEKNRALDYTIAFVNDRLLLISGELGGVESNLQDFRQQNTVIDIPAQSEQDIQRLTAIREKLDDSQVKLEVVDMIANYLNDPTRTYNLVPSTLGIEDVTLLELVKRYNEAVFKREELLKTLAPGNLAIVSLENQLQQLRVKIIETTKNIKKTYQTSYNAANSDYNRVMRSMKSIPAQQKSLLEIERQQGIKEKLYLYLMEKREEAAITRASTVPSSAPLDPAKTSDVPISPNKTSFYSVALLLGFGIPISLILLKDFLNDKITTRTDLIQLTKVPIIGEVIHVRRNQSKMITGNVRSNLAEHFRVIRTNLSFFLKGQSKSVILVTSSMPNEGKSFISTNLGAVLALSGKKVVLLEFDLRKPNISISMGVDPDEKGITNYLAGEIPVNDVLKRIPEFQNFFLISSGPVPPNPGDLLLGDKVSNLMHELKDNFDYVIIDTPPIGIVSDAKVLSAFSDLNLYVVRQRFTLKKQMEIVNELHTSKTFANMSLVVNDIYTVGGRGYYGYSKGYTYGNYYYDNSALHGYGNTKRKGWRKKNLKSS